MKIKFKKKREIELSQPKKKSLIKQFMFNQDFTDQAMLDTASGPKTLVNSHGVI